MTQIKCERYACKHLSNDICTLGEIDLSDGALWGGPSGLECEQYHNKNYTETYYASTRVLGKEGCFKKKRSDAKKVVLDGLTLFVTEDGRITEEVSGAFAGYFNNISDEMITQIKKSVAKNLKTNKPVAELPDLPEGHGGQI